MIVDDGEAEVKVVRAIARGPLLEVIDKLLIRDDVSVIDIANGGDVVEHVLEHRLTRALQQRFRLIEC